MTRSTLALLALAAGLAACAPVEGGGMAAGTDGERSAEGRQCFFVREVSGYRDAPDGPGGAERIYVDVGARETYLFETFGACPELDWAHGIGFDARGVGSICHGYDVELIVPDRNLGPRRCPVRMVQKVPKAETR